MPRVYAKKLKQWNDDDIRKTIEKVYCGRSMWKPTANHKMSWGKLT